MSDRRKLISPVSELFSPDQRTGAGDRKHRARKIRKLTSDMRVLWSRHTISPHCSYRARRMPRVGA